MIFDNLIKNIYVVVSVFDNTNVDLVKKYGKIVYDGGIDEYGDRYIKVKTSKSGFKNLVRLHALGLITIRGV